MNGRFREWVRVSLAVLTIVSVWAITPPAAALTLEDISGQYYFGSLGGCTLKIRPQGTFSFVRTDCCGTSDENRGKAALRDDVLHLMPEKANVEKGFRGMSTNLFPIPWQGRMYLVHDLVGFCAEINQGTEPRQLGLFYYLREKDWDKPVTGMPEVPEAFSKYLLKKPVKGKIVQVLKECEAWVDVGTEQGILPGMIVTARPQDGGLLTQLRVEAVEPTRSRVVCKYRDGKLAAGQTVSSRFCPESAAEPGC